MGLLLTSVTVKDPQSPHDGHARDILIKNGSVTEISASVKDPGDVRIIDCKGLCISPSWVDIGCYSGEPGNEQRETFDSLRNAALKGGYGHLAILPETDPPVDNSSLVNSIKAQNRGQSVQLLPMAALSKGLHGKELTEFLDLDEAGTVAFTDGNKAIRSSSFMLKALEYVKRVDRPIFHQPHNEYLIPGAMVHESETSTRMGLKGWPSLTETLLMDRDLELLKYTESHLVWHQISSADSLKRVRWAKDQGLRLHCGVSYLHLCYNEQEIEDFDTHFKLSPPLRSAPDQEALWEGIFNDDIDYICSGHRPWEVEKKKLEFPFAAYGAEGLETAFSTFLNSSPENKGVDIWIQKCAITPRRILNLTPVVVDKGEKTDYTLFDPKEEFVFKMEDIASLSKNNPNIGRSQKGKVKARISGNDYIEA